MQSCNLCKWFVCMSWHDASTACWAHNRIRHFRKLPQNALYLSTHESKLQSKIHILLLCCDSSSFPHKTYVSPFVSLEQFFIFIWNRMDTTSNIGTELYNDELCFGHDVIDGLLADSGHCGLWSIDLHWIVGQNQLVCYGDVNAWQSTLIYT
jgi:hypothetical protein